MTLTMKHPITQDNVREHVRDMHGRWPRMSRAQMVIEHEGVHERFPDHPHRHIAPGDHETPPRWWKRWTLGHTVALGMVLGYCGGRWVW